MNALGQSASPRLARLAVESDRAGFVALLWKLLATGTAIGVAGVLAAIFNGRDVVALLFTAEYAAHQTALVALMIGAAFGFVASFLGYAMTALRETMASSNASGSPSHSDGITKTLASASRSGMS